MRSRILNGLVLVALFVAQVSSAQTRPISDSYSRGLIGSAIGTIPAEPEQNIKPNTSSASQLFNDALPLRKSMTALLRIKADKFFGTRSAKDAQLYQRASPAVVLVISKDGIGSGSLISRSGEILTNWHVVRDAKEVGVIFKPVVEGQGISKSDIRRAKVVRFDEVSDLALVKVAEVPAAHEPLRLGDASEISIGSDVHAIGHPTGEAWTYTKGVISQYRQNYSWSTGEAGKKHQANVIQTQTPINPGNSGGPLLSDSGLLIGVNSFKAQGEALNFAVSVDDVRQFLLSRSSRSAEEIVRSTPQRSSECGPKEVYKGRTKDNKSEIVAYDLNCSGQIDFEIIAPLDQSLPIVARVDRNKDKKADVLVFDFDRDGKWDLSYWDNDFDGKWDSVGFHPDGEIEPSRYESYASFQASLAKKQ